MKSLPKIELHHHIEGAAPPAFVRALAKQKNMDISGIFDERGGYHYDGFLQFLDVYEAATAPLSTPRDYADLVTAVLEEAAEHGVVYLESFLSPDFCGGRDVGAWKEYLHAMQDAANAAEAQGITLRGIVTCIRHFGPEAAIETARCAQETAGDWVVGFGMGGDENAGHPRDFAYAFDMAREAGLSLTSHAGEWRGPQEIRDTLTHLKVARIGHGVRAIEDAALVEHLAETGVVLEVCPGSNVALGVYRDFASHPIARLREAGVKVTISTDDPPFFHTTMTREYEELARAFGWDEGDFSDLNKVALNAAFCDENTRARIAKKLEPSDV
ncbi:adenosine deaminase [Maritimibacter fusiformis]|uniref:Adenosine deaminase n=1 Tax=Maritimibacter fusiformis TaxID=2603819 RepID=A0A5D0RHI6_9RHOB|nr:adenosine deaminase [Maritimibacter fusiformis]TYB80499.1 adenosine deaminase [Maritimibacter fusiformis]